MRFDRRLVGLGIFLLTVGSVMLAVRQGWLSDDFAGRAWSLWPLLLVGAGLSIVLSGRPGAAIGGLVVVITAGAILGGLATTGWAGGFGACGSDRTGTRFEDQGGDLGSRSAVSIEISCGRLAIGTVAGSTWSLSGSSPDGAAPRIRERSDGIQIDSPDGAPFTVNGGRNDWSVAIPRDAGVDLDVATNGGSSDIVLGGARLGDVTFATNAGSLTLDLREVLAIGNLDVHANFGSSIVRLPARSLAGKLSANAGSLALCLPAGVGLRVAIDSVAASNDLAAHGLVEVDQGWETPGYRTATDRLDLEIDVNAGSLSLDPDRECAG